MGVFSGCLLACDIDGTLMANGKINPRNVEKIDYFMSEGGYFSLSTGRTVGAVGPVLSIIKRVSPSVVANGCMIYDYENKRVLDELFLPENEYYIAKKVLDMGRNIGIEAHSGEKILNLNTTQETLDHQEYEWISGEEVTFEEASGYRWNKVVYLFDNDRDLAAVKELIAGESSSSRFIDTSAVIGGRKRNYYEQFPAGVSKASELDKLKKTLKIDKGCYFAMGDYYNDLEMIKAADISAVPSETPEDIKAYADFVAGKCEDGAVADFIDYLAKFRSDRA